MDIQPSPSQRKRQAAIATSDDELLKKQLAWYFLLRVIFITLILGITAILETPERQLTTILQPHYPLVFIIGVYLVTIVSAILLGGINQPRHFALLQIILDILLISGLIFFSGISQSLFTVVYFLPIIAASLMLAQRGALLIAALATIAYGALLFLEYSHLSSPLTMAFIGRPGADLERLLNLFAIKGLSFFFVAALASILAERLSRTKAELSQTTSRFDHLSALYRQIFDNISSGIITVDHSHTITSFNPAAEQISGYKAKQVVGLSLAETFPEIKLFNDTGATGAAGAMITRNESEISCQNGEKIPVGYSWSPLPSPQEGEKDYILALQDLSRIREMEARVRQSEKMAAVGEMAAGVAHEFRNPLASISGSAQLLIQHLGDQPGQEKLLAIIVRECDRLEAAIKKFLLFSRPTRPKQEWVDIGEICRESILLISQTPACTKKHKLALKLEIEENLKIWADRDQLKQALLNLLSNACQATPTGGEIKCIVQAKQNQGQAATLITIQDKGLGMSPAVQAKIFNPYFTTRQEGTGLGLAIVHQIVNGHGGHIELKSAPGQGATFTVHLPGYKQGI